MDFIMHHGVWDFTPWSNGLYTEYKWILNPVRMYCTTRTEGFLEPMRRGPKLRENFYTLLVQGGENVKKVCFRQYSWGKDLWEGKKYVYLWRNKLLCLTINHKRRTHHETEKKNVPSGRVRTGQVPE